MCSCENFSYWQVWANIKFSFCIQNVFEDLPKPASSSAATKRPASVLTHPVAKYITHPKPKPQTPVSSRSPTPPPPATPLPDYIKKFVGTDWFDKYFPNCKENVSDKTIIKSLY